MATDDKIMKKILIVDDEPNITEILSLFAQQLGYSSDAVHSGESAVERIKSNQYWAIFCDFQMSGLNGLMFYDKVKELNADLCGRFVLLTGSVLDDHAEASVKKEKIRVLPKPFYFDGIKQVFHELEM